MTILITGGNFYNKGGELMLVTLVNKLHELLPEATLCVSPFLGNDSKLKDMDVLLLNFPLYHYGDKKDFEWALHFPFLFRTVMLLKGKSIKGEISLKKIDVVLDISGFAFGEKWGSAPLKNLKMFSKKMTKLGSKFILIPQAFGPFTIGSMKSDMTEVIHNCNLIFTRDEQSFKYVVNEAKTDVDKSKVLMFPDITLTYKKSIEINDAIFKNPFCAIVPNERMLDKASKRWQNKYFDVLNLIMNIIMSKSTLHIIMLIHAQGHSSDAKVGKKAIDNLSGTYKDRIHYYVEEDPVRLKSIISKSEFLIGSRFHALASALSSNIPAIGTSWLHKYEMLFKDYNLEEFSFNEPEEEIYQRVESLLNDEFRNKIKLELASQNDIINQKSNTMWSIIKNEITK